EMCGIGSSTTRGKKILITSRECIKEVKQMSRTRVFSEIWQYMKSNKKYWLVPIVLVLVTIGVLLAVAGSSALAPFVYTLFLVGTYSLVNLGVRFYGKYSRDLRLLP